MTTYTEIRRSTVLEAFPLLASRRGDRRRRHAESRHDWRQHRQRVAGGRYAPGTARLRRRAGATIGRGHAPRPVRELSSRLQADGSSARRAHRAHPSAAARVGWLDYYRKVGTRRAQAISKVCFAGAIRMEGTRIGDIRIALASVAPVPFRALRAEEALRGQTHDPASSGRAVDALAAEIARSDDIRSTARYRTRVAGNLLREFLTKSYWTSRLTNVSWPRGEQREPDDGASADDRASHANGARRRSGARESV